MRNSGLEEAQAGIKIARRNTNKLTYADDTNLMAEREEELKSLLMKVKEESKKVGFKVQHSENEDHGIWCLHFTADRWGNSGNNGWLYFQFSSVAQSCPIVCNPMNRSTPGLPVHHQLPEFTQTHAH